MQKIEPIQDVLVSLDINLQVLGWVKVERSGTGRTVHLLEPRLVWWAIAALEVSGFDPERLLEKMQELPVNKHWWFLRQRLPDEAIRALGVKLSVELKQKQEVSRSA